jgi:hypothetical protein
MFIRRDQGHEDTLSGGVGSDASRLDDRIFSIDREHELRAAIQVCTAHVELGSVQSHGHNVGASRLTGGRPPMAESGGQRRGQNLQHPPPGGPKRAITHLVSGADTRI